MTLWETEEDMARNEEAVRRVRVESAAAPGEEVVGVERFEVVLGELVVAK